MKIITKRQADKVLMDSLFRPINGKTLRRMRFDMGKYKPTSSFLGREAPNLQHVHAVYAERRRDADGPYICLMCLSE